MRDRLRRAPLVAKLTALYALAAVVLLAVVGGIVFVRFESALNRTIDADLRSRAQALGSLVDLQGPSVLGTETAANLLRPQGGVAQVVDRRSGRILATSRALRGHVLLDAGQVAAVRGTTMFTRTGLRGVAKRARFAAAPLSRPPRLVVVGRSLKDREGANESFARALLIGGPLALLLTSIAAYALARAALRPVESMRRRAASISTAEPHVRLPVGPADDEIGRLGHTLNAMLARLERSFEQQRHLTANASHELRTPLSILISRLEIALRRERSADELREALGETLVEARRLGALADDLLALARLEAGQDGLELQPVDLDVLVAAVVGARHTAGRIVRTPASGLVVTADPPRLERALGNLVANALLHGEGTVTVTAAATGDAVRLTVVDEGPGIPADFAADAFERFARHRSARSRPGSGLGLALVHAVIQAHGGRVGIGPGAAEVWLELPAHRPAAP